MNVSNKDRFPHVYALQQLGGYKSADGEKYHEDHENELQIELDEIMQNILDRDKFGGSKNIHVRYD